MGASDEGLLTTIDRAHQELDALDAYLRNIDVSLLTQTQRAGIGLAVAGVLALLAAAEAVHDLVTVVETDGAGGAHTARAADDQPSAG